MASIFNISQATKKRNDNDERTLLTAWTAKDTDIPKDHKVPGMCVRWAPDDSLLVAGYGDGVVRVFDPKGRLMKRINDNRTQASGGMMDVLKDGGEPIMALRFNPKRSTLLRIATADGMVEQVDTKSRQSKQSIQEKDSNAPAKNNSIHAIDYDIDGKVWASGGKDRVIRVYDENKKEPIKELSAGRPGTDGHINKVSSIAFSPKTPSIIATAGLDGVVHVWDIRDSNPVPTCTIGELAVFGDALDWSEDGQQLLTGSYRPLQQLQLWDMRASTRGEPLTTISWKRPETSALKKKWSAVRAAVKGSTNVFDAQFIGARTPSEYAGGIVAGGTGAKEVKLFKKTADGFEAVGACKVESGVLGLNVSNDGRMIACVSINGDVVGVQTASAELPEQMDV